MICSAALDNKIFQMKTSAIFTLAELPATSFMQVHKSFLVNLEKVQTFGDGHIRILDKLIPISRSRLQAVTQRILGDDLINGEWRMENGEWRMENGEFSRL